MYKQTVKMKKEVKKKRMIATTERTREMLSAES